MASKLNNWSYREVTDFLKENGFDFFEQLEGPRQSWMKLAETGVPERFVAISYRHDNYPEKTLKRIIRESGIDEMKWRGQ